MADIVERDLEYVMGIDATGLFGSQTPAGVVATGLTSGDPAVDAAVRAIVNNPSTLIFAKFASSLFPEVGPMPNYYTSVLSTPAVPTIVDCFGILRDGNPGEALFYGARRVENLMRFSEHLSNTASTAWFLANSATIAPITDPRRPGKDGDMTAWKLSRGATANSVWRTQTALRRRNGVAGLDLLLPVPHFAGINMRRSTTNIVTTAEPRVYTSGGPVATTKIINITETMETYGLTFTPAAPKRLTTLSWAASVLTVSCTAHGYTTGMTIRLSGSIPSAFDIDATVASVPDANTFTVAMGSNPGTNTTPGWTQPQYVFGLSPGSWASTALGDIEIEMPYVTEMQDYPALFVPEYVPRDRVPQRKYWYGSAVDGVKCFDSAAGWVYDSASGKVTQGTGAALATCKGLTTFALTGNAIPRKYAEAFSAWVKSDTSMTVADAAAACPLASPEASKITEGTHTGRHYVELPTGVLTNANTANDIATSITCYLATPGGAAGRDWCVLSFVDRAGVEQFGYFNIATGATGTKTAGFQYLSIESLGTMGGLKYWRAHVSALLASGSSAPSLRIGLASADNTNSYAGSGTRYIVAWGASLVGTTLQRPVAGPYGRRLWDDTATLAGASLSFAVAGLLGLNDITAASRYTPYYTFYQPGRVDWTAALYFRCEPVQTVSGATSSIMQPASLDRFGLVIRPNPGTSDAPNNLTKVAFDHYNGDPTARYMFVPGKTYQVGDVVLPTATQPNNPTAEKTWQVTIAGVSGTEPAWPAVTSLPSSTVTSGSVTFQVTHDNGLIGAFEPYNGAHIQPPAGFMAEARIAYFISTSDYGGFINGLEAEKQTLPNPVNPTYGFSMRRPIAYLYVGSLGADNGTDPTTMNPYLGSDAAGLMPRHTSFNRDVAVWKGAKTAAALKAYTA